MSDRSTYFYNSQVTDAAFRGRWWAEEDPGRHMCAVAKSIENDQKPRETQNIAFARLYSNQLLETLYSGGVVRWGQPGGASDGQNNLSHRVTYNVVQSCIDTAAAKIAKNKPRVLFLTSGGDWEAQQQAKKLTTFADGLFYTNDLYEMGQRCFVDACTFGDGWIKVYAEGEEIKAERVLPFEVVVDDTESVYGKPPSMYQKKYIYRPALLDMFGKDEDARYAIERAAPADPAKQATKASDMIPVFEGWHLPSGPKATDGRHVIAIEQKTLFDERWSRNWFPLIPFRWADRTVGLRGQGLAEQLIGIQLEINKLLRTIQQAQHLMAVPRVFLEHGSKVLKSHINNAIGAVVEYTGAPPQISVGAAVAPELYQHLDSLYAKAFEITGISALSATAQKPAGLNAAVALREYHDIESERFVVQGQRYERWFVDIARTMVDLARDMYKGGAKGGKDVTVRAPGGKFLQTVKWSEVELADDAYVMKAFPTSILPTTPAGRLERVSRMYESGLLTDQSSAGVWARSVLDFPDLESAMSLQNAAMDDAQRVVCAITEHGEYESPRSTWTWR